MQADAVSEASEQYRRELTGYCYRMLASPFDAENAAQETMMRAWQHADRFDPAKGSNQSWLYKIATNVCLDALRGFRRRTRSMDLSGPREPGPDIGSALPEDHWVLPIADRHVLHDDNDPLSVHLQREIAATGVRGRSATVDADAASDGDLARRLGLDCQGGLGPARVLERGGNQSPTSTRPAGGGPRGRRHGRSRRGRPGRLAVTITSRRRRRTTTLWR